MSAILRRKKKEPTLLSPEKAKKFEQRAEVAITLEKDKHDTYSHCSSCGSAYVFLCGEGYGCPDPDCKNYGKMESGKVYSATEVNSP